MNRLWLNTSSIISAALSGVSGLSDAACLIGVGLGID